VTRRVAFPILVLVLAAAIGALGALLLGPAPLAAPSSACTKIGTAVADSISGTPGADYICARGGGDYVHGQSGSDILLGEGGTDTLIGGAGRDDVRGGNNDDQLFVVDQIRGNDKIDGGGGFDRCYLDLSDSARNCESITRGATPVSFAALNGEVRDLVEFSEELQDPTPPPQCTPPPEPIPEAC